MDTLMLAPEQTRLPAAAVTVRGFTVGDADVQRRWPVPADPLLESYNLRLSDSLVAPYHENLMSRTDYVRFSVEAGGELVGTISLREMQVGSRTARLGIVLRADLIGSGLGGAALEAFLRLYFGRLGYEALELDVAAVNGRALRCYQRLGFRWVGRHWQAVEIAPADVPLVTNYHRFPQYFRVEGGQVWILHYDMRMTRQDFAPRLRGGR